MSQSNEVYCEHCNMEINVRDDLVVVFVALDICAFHAKCYGERVGKTKGFFMSDTPINGRFPTFILFILFILAVVGLMIGGEMIAFSIGFILFGLVRLYSLLAYERHIPK